MSTVVVHVSQPGATTLLTVATRYSPPAPVTSTAMITSCDWPSGARTTAKSSASSTCRWPLLWPTGCMAAKRWPSARATAAGRPVSVGSSARRTAGTGGGGGAGRNWPQPESSVATTAAGARRRAGHARRENEGRANAEKSMPTIMPRRNARFE